MQKFHNAEQAWFWTIGALRARREGTRSSRAGTPRPCDPDDVIKCLDRLYRNRRVDLVHARIMRIWGERQAAPNPAHPSERSDHRLWTEAMERLGGSLRVKGIVEELSKE
jgi:hypothetical protein